MSETLASVLASAGQALKRGPVLAGAGALAGAGLGRYVIAPILQRLGFDEEKSERTLTRAGAGLGLLPGLLSSATMWSTRGSPFAPWGSPPNTEAQALQDFARARQLAKMGSDVPVGAGGLWSPSFGVSSAVDAVIANTLTQPWEKFRQAQLVIQAGQEQGAGGAGLASPAALMTALPEFASNAIPRVGAAILLSKLLGAPAWVSKGSIGGALLYSAFKTFMEPKHA